MIDAWLELLSTILQDNYLLAPLLVFVGGVLTSLTPCSLSSIPLIVGYIGYITNVEETDKNGVLKVSLIFALGQVVSFTVIGFLTSVLGRLMSGAGRLWYLFLGVLMLLMALQLMEVINIVRPLHIQSNKKGKLGAFITGLVGGVFASPCATPILIVLMGIISSSENIIWGILLMFLYALGVNTLVLLSGLFTGLVTNILNNKNYNKLTVFLKYILSSIVLIVSFYLFWLSF